MDMFTTQNQINTYWERAQEDGKIFRVVKTATVWSYYAKPGDIYQTKVINEGKVVNESPEPEKVPDDGIQRVWIEKALFLNGVELDEVHRYPIPESEFIGGRYIIPEGYNLNHRAQYCAKGEVNLLDKKDEDCPSGFVQNPRDWGNVVDRPNTPLHERPLSNKTHSAIGNGFWARTPEKEGNSEAFYFIPIDEAKQSYKPVDRDW